MNPSEVQASRSGDRQSPVAALVNIKPTKFAAQRARLSVWMHGLLPDVGGPGSAEMFVMAGNPRVVC